jgi:hypothetical protein
MTDGSWGNPWKLTTIGLVVLIAAALVAEIVVAHRFGAGAERQPAVVATPASRVAAAPAPQPAVARAPQPVSSTPPRASIEACHQQAEQASRQDKTVEGVKDGAIGVIGVAAVGAAAQDQRYRDAYARCMHARGHAG